MHYTFSKVEVHPEKYFENTLNILRHSTRIEQSRLGSPVNKTLMKMAPAVVNAYYVRNNNRISKYFNHTRKSLSVHPYTTVLISMKINKRSKHNESFPSVPSWNSATPFLPQTLSQSFELRWHRNGHRPRNHSRIRWQRSPIRQTWKFASLVEGRRHWQFPAKISMPHRYASTQTILQ